MRLQHELMPLLHLIEESNSLFYVILEVKNNSEKKTFWNVGSRIESKEEEKCQVFSWAWLDLWHCQLHHLLQLWYATRLLLVFLASPLVHLWTPNIVSVLILFLFFYLHTFLLIYNGSWFYDMFNFLLWHWNLPLWVMWWIDYMDHKHIWQPHQPTKGLSKYEKWKF